MILIIRLENEKLTVKCGFTQRHLGNFFDFSALWIASQMGGASVKPSVIGRFRPATNAVFVVGAPDRVRAGKADIGGGICAGIARKEHILRQVTAFYSQSRHLEKSIFLFQERRAKSPPICSSADARRGCHLNRWRDSSDDIRPKRR